MVKKYKIYAGLGGGFGGAFYHKTAEYSSLGEAEKDAWLTSVEEYENYCGSGGLREYQDCLTEAESEVREEDFDNFSDYERELEMCAEVIYQEEMENWIDYYVEEVV